MILAVGGSRGFTFEHFHEIEYVMEHAIKKFGDIDEIVHGDCPEGADQLFDMWATDHAIARTLMPVSGSEWKKYGKPRGPERNARLLTRATAYACLWDGQSPGTGGLIELCKWSRVPMLVHVVRLKGSKP